MLTGDIPFRVLGLVLRFFLAPYVGTRGGGSLNRASSEVDSARVVDRARVLASAFDTLQPSSVERDGALVGDRAGGIGASDTLGVSNIKTSSFEGDGALVGNRAGGTPSLADTFDALLEVRSKLWSRLKKKGDSSFAEDMVLDVEQPVIKGLRIN